jgi:hypothetical protein
MTATCRSCGAPILWAIASGSGKRMPLDAEPVEDGSLVVVRHRYEGSGQTIPIVEVVGEDEHLELVRFRSHFATCPDAKTWRSR